MSTHKKDLSGDRIFEQARKIAEVYGFKDVKSFFNTYDEREEIKIRERKLNSVLNDDLMGSKALLKKYIGKGLVDEKDTFCILYHSNIDTVSATHTPLRKKNCSSLQFTLTALDMPNYIAEVYLIWTALSILKEFGYSPTVTLNSVGDVETARRYAKDLKEYIHRNRKGISSKGLQRFSKNIAEGIQYIVENEDTTITQKIPQTLRCLSEESQQHLKAIIDSLEGHDIPYEIKGTLLPDFEQYNQSIVHINTNDDGPIAYGGRNEGMCETIYGRKVPMLTLTLSFPCTGKLKTKSYEPIKRRKRKPLVFFRSAGYNAQIKSLELIEKMREANIPFRHRSFISRPTLQLSPKEEQEFSHVVILGEQEILDSTIIVRSVEKSIQNNIPYDTVIPHLKRIL